MTIERFWVVGGDYTCTGFKSLREGTSHVSGPYDTRDEAQRAWRTLSEESRSTTTAKFSITAENVRLPN